MNDIMLTSEHKRILHSAQERHDENIKCHKSTAFMWGLVVGTVCALGLGIFIGMMITIYVMKG